MRILLLFLVLLIAHAGINVSKVIAMSNAYNETKAITIGVFIYGTIKFVQNMVYSLKWFNCFIYFLLYIMAAYGIAYLSLPG